MVCDDLTNKKVSLSSLRRSRNAESGGMHDGLARVIPGAPGEL